MISSPNSYFTAQEASVASIPVFIFTLGGSYVVPQADIIDPGQLTLNRSTTFSDLTSSGGTLILNNASGIYSPGRSTFIWSGQSWYHKSIQIELGYKRPGFQAVVDKVVIYQGIIIEWKITERKDSDPDAATEGLMVEISYEDHVALLQNRLIGQPDDSGTPNPFVHGRILREAVELGNKVFWSPTDTIDYETGDLSQVDSVTGSVTVNTTHPYGGTYAAQHQISSGAKNAYGQQDVGGAGGSNEMHVSAQFYFTAIPLTKVGSSNVAFLELVATNGHHLQVTCDENGKLLVLYVGLDSETSNILIDDYLDRYIRLDLMVRVDTSNRVFYKLFVDNNMVISKEQTGLNPAWRYARWGLQAGIYEDWEVWSDNINCYNICYPLGYYLPGGSYSGINEVYVDAAFWPRYNKSMQVLSGPKWSYMVTVYVGRSAQPENYRTEPSYGLVDFLDYGNPVSGSVLIDATKDSTSHPVDLISAVLQECDLDSLIGASNFAAVKTASPDDTLAIYIDNQSAADAISAICELMLYDFMELQGEFRLLPYAGTPKVSGAMTANRSNCHEMEQNTNQSDLKTEVTAKWGWWDKDNRLFYRKKNDDMIALVGKQTLSMDASVGQNVYIDDATLMKAKADLALKRFSGPVEQFTLFSNLSLARLEIGDGLTVNAPFINDDDLIYEVVGKTVDITQKTIEITANRYLGEA